jgi:Domain of unknown function (DUF4832)/Domain of unknown function (DUF4874)
MTTMHGQSLTLGILIALCLAPGRSHSQDAPPWREIRYRESSQNFPNPERGFYAPRTSHRIGRLDGLRQRGITLLLIEVDLKAFKERDLTTEKLDEVRRAFAAARQNGLKTIVRFAYGFTGRDYRSDPKDMDRILSHIRQLGKVFQENRDVLFAVQAGFLGPWGEWHGSNWGDPPSLEARRSVLFALLDAVAGPITVHVRRPMFIRDIFADEPGGAELTEATAYGGSRLSRVGWHDDALLSLPTDLGTYAQRGWDRERELRWCAEHGRFTPFGGETVPSSARTPIAQVVRELELLHATYLNSSYHRGTLDGWKKAAYQGATGFEHIERRLGYRLVADRLRITEVVKPGGILHVELDLHNVGFAPPLMPRQAALVLSQGDRTVRVALTDADPRRWAPEAGTVTLRGAMPIPAGARGGRWRLALQLTDPAPSLNRDGRFAIRLADEGIAFDEANGSNVLAEDVEIRER